MAELVTIFGGSGFVGRYIARRMAAEGWRVRVAVRRPNEAMFVRPFGAVGQVEPVFANVRDDASVRRAMEGASAVVYCVGTFDIGGANRFDAIQALGPDRVARIAAEDGVGRMVLISALGADATSDSVYLRTKAQGEAAVLARMPGAMILRPSVVFGPEDGFFNRFAAMSRFGPFLAIAGGETRFQPVYADDVAQAAVEGVTGRAPGGVYELGGPDVDTLGGWIRAMLEVTHRRRIIVNLPFWAAGFAAICLDALQSMTLGLVHNGVITRDQLRALKVDNVVSDGARGFAELGIRPTAAGAVLPEYLWRFRPSGQYDAIKDSARNLKA